MTVSFNLKPGVSLGDAVDELQELAKRDSARATSSRIFTGTRRRFRTR